MIRAWQLADWLNKISAAHAMIEQQLRTAPLDHYGELLQATLNLGSVRDGLMKHAIQDVKVEHANGLE